MRRVPAGDSGIDASVRGEGLGPRRCGAVDEVAANERPSTTGHLRDHLRVVRRSEHGDEEGCPVLFCCVPR